MDPGIYDGIPAEEYRTGAGVSVSTLKLLSEEGGPARVRYGAREETKAQFIGTLIHTAILEPDRLDRVYHVVDLPRLDERSRAYQAEELKAAGREIVRRADFDNALRIRDAVLRQSAVARDMLKPSPHLKVERSFYWIDPETGILCRGRADGVRLDYRVLFDIKSCNDATRDGFSKAIGEYDYHWQHAHYCDGTALAPGGFIPETFIFIAVEKEPPYLVATYELEPEDVQEGRAAVSQAIRHYARCLEADDWPGLPDTLQPINLPRWKRNKGAQV